MKALRVSACLIALAVSGSALADPADPLVGLWRAKLRFGPDARGPLTVQRRGRDSTADMLGHTIPVRADHGALAFDLPDGDGSFAGRLSRDGREITGHWISRRSRVASPVRLRSSGPDRWSGEVAPGDETITLFLKVDPRPDGTLGAFLRNPERNLGVFYNIDHIAREGNAVKLYGTTPWQKEKEQRVLLTGSFDPEHDILSVAFPDRGGTYDFRRDGDSSDFYPRGKVPARYAYRPPLSRDDGWPTGTLEDAGIDRTAIEKFIQAILDMPIESVRTPQIEGILVARHGKLVLEEYFHGEHRDNLHDTRSAAKSLTATVVGAAMQAGIPLKLSDGVYRVMNGGALPPGLEPLKQAMTLENLMTMASGWFCDDSNPDAPGNEDAMDDQEAEPDYYRYTLKVPMAFPPGEHSIYCSCNANLALGMVGRAAGESPLEVFDRLVGEPLGIRRYTWPLDRAGNPYGGGGAHILPRDFMKLGQLMLDGGTWKGRRILSREFVARASSPLYHMRGIEYGYFWWVFDLPYKNRSVRAYFAAGNGGQGVIVIPDLDLVIATYGGNYADRASIHITQELPVTWILPAVREPGDDRNAPVQPREFKTPYGPSKVDGPVKPK